MTQPSTIDHSVVGRLRRIRWAVRLALTIGVAASVTANVLHAAHNPVSQGIAAWPPLALLLTVELVARVPVHARRLAIVRVLATSVIAGIAAWVSYWHMAALAARYGETPTTAYLLPISVDGLIVVASICLVELAHSINTTATISNEPTSTDHSGQTAPAASDPMPADTVRVATTTGPSRRVAAIGRVTR
jgi:hypothetical protein